MTGGKDESSTNTRKITAYPFEETLQELAVMAEQRHREKDTDLQRRSMHVGSLFVAISEEPGSDGRYGTRTPELLATLIRPYVVMAMDWLQEHGSPIHGARGDTSGPMLTALLALATRTEGAPPAEQRKEASSMASSLFPLTTEEYRIPTGLQPFMLSEDVEQDLGLGDDDIL